MSVMGEGEEEESVSESAAKTRKLLHEEEVEEFEIVADCGDY